MKEDIKKLQNKPVILVKRNCTRQFLQIRSQDSKGIIKIFSLVQPTAISNVSLVIINDLIHCNCNSVNSDTVFYRMFYKKNLFFHINVAHEI